MMLRDCGANSSARPRDRRDPERDGYQEAVTPVALDDSGAGEPFSQWLAPEGAAPARVVIAPDDPFNIIYSSGTTGAPKGIVQPHRMRFGQFLRISYKGAVTIVSTPLYSNTTLVVFLPTLAHGGAAVLLPNSTRRVPSPFGEASRDARDAGSSSISADHGARRLRPVRSFELRPEALDQRAVRGGAEGRRAEALAGWTDRILRHDRGRRRVLLAAHHFRTSCTPSAGRFRATRSA